MSCRLAEVLSVGLFDLISMLSLDLAASTAPISIVGTVLISNGFSVTF